METFFDAYVTAALWSTTDNSTPQGGEPLDSNYGKDDIDQSTLAQMEHDCNEFQKKNDRWLRWFYDSGHDEARAGHNFWLNRNGHGSGFWDEFSKTKQPELYRVGEMLSNASKAFGEFDLYVGDDNRIYGSGPMRNRQQAKLLKKKADNFDTSVDLGTGARETVLELLRQGPKTTGDLEQALGGGKYSNKSWPILQALKDEGVISQSKMRWHLTASLVRIFAKLNAIPKKSAQLSVPERHQLNIAIKTMKMPDAMVGVMGGMNKQEAEAFLAKHGYRWDEADYMAGGKGIKRAAQTIIKRLTGREYDRLPASVKHSRTGAILLGGKRIKRAKDVNGLFKHPDADRYHQNVDASTDLTAAYMRSFGGYRSREAPLEVQEHINKTYTMEASRPKPATKTNAMNKKSMLHCVIKDQTGSVEQAGNTESTAECNKWFQERGVSFDRVQAVKSNGEPFDAVFTFTRTAATKKIARDLNLEQEYEGRTYRLTTWQERDRFNINLVNETDNQEIFDVWDEDAVAMVEDGFFDWRDPMGSLLAYAAEMSMLPAPRVEEETEIEASAAPMRTVGSKPRLAGKMPEKLVARLA